MSEIINNRQQRIDIMKGFIRQLHKGVAEDMIRSQLEKLLNETDYADVFLMEMQLIQEGIPAETIRELCDTHTRVLKKHLDPQKTPETKPERPDHTFIQENNELTKRTAAGLSERNEDNLTSFNNADSDPDWIRGESVLVVNGTEMLARGEHPLNLIYEQMEKMKQGNFLILVTNFHPHPLIDKMTEKSYQVYSRTDVEDTKIHLTWFGK